MKRDEAKGANSFCGVSLDEFSRKTIKSLSGKNIAKRVAEQSKILDGITARSCSLKPAYK